MGSLANLYISQSYTSLIHLGNDTTASAAFVELQDGLGNGLGISVNTQGDISASGNLYLGALDIEGPVRINSDFSASTPAYYNSYDPYYSNAIRVTGSYATAGGNPPSLEDVKVGWIANGIGINNATVTSITIVSPTDRYYFVDQCCPAASQYYTFTGEIFPPVEITGSLIVTDNLIVSGTFDIEGGVRINDDVQVTGSVDISNNLTASNAEFRDKLKVDTIEQHTTNHGVTILSNVSLAQNVDVTGSLTASAAFIETDLIVSGTLFAREVHTLIESSSIIFSTGSNILGDSILDIQTLNGTTIMSGSSSLTGSMGITNNLNVIGNISSSTLSGVGNVTLYSASVDNRLDYLELYTASAEQKFLAIQASTASLNAYTASQDQKNAAVATFTGSTYVTFSQSVDFRLDELENWSSSLQTTFVTEAELTATASLLQNNIDTKLNTSSFNSYSSSVGNALNAQSARIDGLASFTGSYATTGSNTFRGNQIFSGSVRGNVLGLTITSNTASMDVSQANFFTLTLVSGSATRLTATNINPGETIGLRITQPSIGYGTLTTDGTIRFPQAFPYNATPSGSAVDIISFQSYDTSVLYGVAVNTMR